MSTKHLRRLIEKKEHVEATELPEEDIPSQRAGPVNRFAAFVGRCVRVALLDLSKVHWLS